MSLKRVSRYTSSDLRKELSYRSALLSPFYPHEATYGSLPSYVFQESAGIHGNFFLDSFRAICSEAQWELRLTKAYTGSKRIARGWERSRFELDCANSSDALLMNIFCLPGLLDRPKVRALLGIRGDLHADFGFRPKIPIFNERRNRILSDRTEIDMALGPLLVEAKLTEFNFQTASLERVLRYRDLTEVFDLEELPIKGTTVNSYQLIRGVLAAHFLNRKFLVLCDARRADLIEWWFQVIRAVKVCDLRHRLAILSWQELAGAVPESLQSFLQTKYGIEAFSE